MPPAGTHRRNGHRGCRSGAPKSSPSRRFFSLLYSLYQPGRTGNSRSSPRCLQQSISPWRTAPRRGRVRAARRSGSPPAAAPARVGSRRPSKLAASSTLPARPGGQDEGRSARRRDWRQGAGAMPPSRQAERRDPLPLQRHRNARLAAGRAERRHDVERRDGAAVGGDQTLRPGEVVEGKRGDRRSRRWRRRSRRSRRRRTGPSGADRPRPWRCAAWPGLGAVAAP